mgnify:CR=1 FL=1
MPLRSNRVVVSSDEESESEPDEPMAERYEARSDGEDSDLSDFVVPDEEMEDDEGSSDSGSSGSGSGTASGTESDDDDDDDATRGIYHNWETLRAMYVEGTLRGEIPGFNEHPELHSWGWERNAPDWEQEKKDEFWERIRAKAADPAWCAEWGVRALEVEHNGRIERLVERYEYGTEFDGQYAGRSTGSYKDAFFRVMEELFEQEPFQGPPEPDEHGELVFPEPLFFDFKKEFCSDHPPGYDQGVRLGEHPDGPLWCFCCQCTDKNLSKVMIARHTLSDILVATGGDCSRKMLGEDEIDYAIHHAADGEAVHNLLRLQ